MTQRHITPFLFCTLLLAACGPGLGRAKFTTWGEEYIEQEIPADASGEGGFIDGWTLRYQKFLVAFHEIKVASSDGTVGATMSGSRLVDNTKPGKKDLVVFDQLEAKAWDQVSYQIKPATMGALLVGASPSDLTFMVDRGYSLYVEGTATKPDGAGEISKSFRLGYDTATQYNDCQQAEESGHAIQGLVVSEGGTDVSELTTHGDHFFYDRLRASPDPAVKTSLRFDEKAAADSNLDGELSRAELDAQPIDVRKYDPSGFDATTMGAFMTALARTVGHFRGEGECSVSRVE